MRPPPRAAHARQDRLDEVEGAAEVGVDHPPPVVEVVLEERAPWSCRRGWRRARRRRRPVGRPAATSAWTCVAGRSRRRGRRRRRSRPRAPSAPGEAVRSLTATTAPSRASRRACAAPIPCPAPVTRATRPTGSVAGRAPTSDHRSGVGVERPRRRRRCPPRRGRPRRGRPPRGCRGAAAAGCRGRPGARHGRVRPDQRGVGRAGRDGVDPHPAGARPPPPGCARDRVRRPWPPRSARPPRRRRRPARSRWPRPTPVARARACRAASPGSG